ncbi:MULTISPECIES: MFS transporter [Bacillus]|uniref:MFS transporter n=1 Tax=Bacillus TaxID=1386 RepID=UPI0002D2D44D|nr:MULTISPECIES: MFS transporter [Bacillus]
MTSIYQSKKFQYIIAANIASSIGSGITMIAVPWLLVTSKDGNEIFGYVTLGMTIFNFFITPFTGVLIDKISRKNLLIAGELLSFIIIFAFMVAGFANIDYGLWQYIVIYVTGSLYYTLFFPTMFAFNQEVFTSEQYKQLNGAMEVQSQFSSMVAGGIASILITRWNLEYILFLNSLTYLVAIYYFKKIQYKKTNSSCEEETNPIKLTEGITFLMKRPIMFIFLLASYIPFIGVMVTNYLFPVYINEVLQGEGWVYALESVIYCIGAVFAGIMIPIMVRRTKNEIVIIFGVICYAVAISLILFANLPLYLSLMFFLALGNAGVRVARNTLFMNSIPNEIMGRVDSVFRLVGLLMRVIILSFFTKMVSEENIAICLIVLSVISLFAVLAVCVSWKKGIYISVKPE